MSRVRRQSNLLVVVAFCAAAMLGIGGRDANAADAPIAVGEISQPSASTTVQLLDPALLRAEAEGEIKMIDVSRLPSSRRFVVSLALTRVGAAASSDTNDDNGATAVVVACKVNAMVRDARTGTMIAIIEAGAHAEGSASSPELRKQVANAAIRSAVRRIPRALGAK